MLGEVVVGCLAREGEIRRRWQMRQNFVAHILKHWLGNVWLGVVMVKNGALSIDQFLL